MGLGEGGKEGRKEEVFFSPVVNRASGNICLRQYVRTCLHRQISADRRPSSIPSTLPSPPLPTQPKHKKMMQLVVLLVSSCLVLAASITSPSLPSLSLLLPCSPALITCLLLLLLLFLRTTLKSKAAERKNLLLLLFFLLLLLLLLFFFLLLLFLFLLLLLLPPPPPTLAAGPPPPPAAAPSLVLLLPGAPHSAPSIHWGGWVGGWVGWVGGLNRFRRREWDQSVSSSSSSSHPSTHPLNQSITYPPTHSPTHPLHVPGVPQAGPHARAEKAVGR